MADYVATLGVCTMLTAFVVGLATRAQMLPLYLAGMTIFVGACIAHG